MRFRITVMLMLALWLPLAGQAEISIDLSTATMEELVSARDAIQERIDELEAAAQAMEIELPVGIYAVGEDLEPGLYVLIENEEALLPSFTLRDAETEETLEFEIISNQMVVLLEEGQVMQLSEATAYPIEFAPVVEITQQTPLVEGGYLVGAQFEAGEYRIVPQEGAIFACFAVYDGPVSEESSILKFVMIYNEESITLEAGQYIVISDCVMMPQEK